MHVYPGFYEKLYRYMHVSKYWIMILRGMKDILFFRLASRQFMEEMSCVTLTVYVSLLQLLLTGYGCT